MAYKLYATESDICNYLSPYKIGDTILRHEINVARSSIAVYSIGLIISMIIEDYSIKTLLFHTISFVIGLPLLAKITANDCAPEIRKKR